MADKNSENRQIYLQNFVRADDSTSEPTNSTTSAINIDMGLEAREFYEKIVSEEAANNTDALYSVNSDKTETKPNTENIFRYSGSNNKGIKRCQDNMKSKRSGESVAIQRLRMKRENERQFQMKNKFFKAVTEGDMSEVERILLIDNKLLDIVDQHGWSPLMCAVAAGHLTIVKYFVQDGVDIENKRDLSGNNALDLAIRFNHRDIIDFLSDRKVERKSMISYSKEHLTRRQDDSIDGVNDNFCELCCTRLNSNELKKHNSSLSHLFNEYKGKELPASYEIGSSNIGYKMLKDAGWSEDKGLGPDGKGQRYPVATSLKSDRSGFGLIQKTRKRITHFKANDVKSVKGNKHIQRNANRILKRQRLRSQGKSKRWEMNLRRYMNDG